MLPKPPDDSSGVGKSYFPGVEQLWTRAMALEDFVRSYRKQLGSYDTKPWERAMEAAVRKKKSLPEVPRRPAKFKWELIDVDLVRGSHFPKEKSQLPWTFFSRDSLLRVVLLPLQRDWWSTHSSKAVFHLLRILYFLQVFSLVMWSTSLYSGSPEECISACESLTPLMLMLIVSEILTQAERQEKKLSSQLDSISDDTSVDFDDLASLSDHSSTSEKARSSFPGKVKRRLKRRTSKLVDFNGEEIIHWRTKSNGLSRKGEYISDEDSTGFSSSHIRLLPEEEETADSGLYGPAQDELEDIESFVPIGKREDDCESDVSDMELKIITKEQDDGSTSDKEASEEETPTQKRLPPESASPVFSGSDEDDLPRHMSFPAVSCQLIGCTLFEDQRLEKADLSVYEITNSVVRQVEKNLVDAGVSRVVLILFPALFALLPLSHSIFCSGVRYLEWREFRVRELVIGVVKCSGVFQRYFWGFWLFLLLAVAHETYQQRYLIAKYFGYLTSSRRAKLAGLPHFRLSKVRNVKSWLCIRSCLKKYGPRKSVDVVVSFCCISCLICVIFTCYLVVKAEDQFTSNIYVWESMLWLFAVGFFLLRFMVLGSKTNQKFRNASVLTTEQLNLYLKMEQKPHKKDQLMLVNNVLKLAADLIKEIEHPCRISGFPANPFLYNVSRLLILSAFSTLVSEICGFKLKLHKLKI